MSNSSVCLNSTLPSLTGTCQRQMRYGVTKETILNMIRISFEVSFAQFVCSLYLSLQKKACISMAIIFFYYDLLQQAAVIYYPAHFPQNTVETIVLHRHHSQCRTQYLGGFLEFTDGFHTVVYSSFDLDLQA